LLAIDPGFAETDAQAKLAIEKNTDWKRFGLYNEMITNESMKYIVKLDKLESLQISGTSITDDGLKNIGSLKKLKELTLNTFKITDKCMKYVSDLKQLTMLDLEGALISDTGIRQLSGFNSLTELGVGYTKVTGTGLRRLQNLKSLRIGEEITNEGLASLGELTELRELQVFGNNIKGKFLFPLLNLKKLRSLDISGDKIVLDDILCFAQLPCLKFIILTDIKITDRDLLKFRIFPHLKSIYLNKTVVTESAIRALKKIRPDIHVCNMKPLLVDALTDNGGVLDLNGKYELGISNSSYGFNSPDSLGGAGNSLNVKINLELTINNKLKITYDGGGMWMPLNEYLINGVVKAGRNSVLIKNIPPVPLYLSIVETRGVNGKKKKFLLHKILNSKNSTTTKEFFFNISK
jgi:hypothetical protein